MDNNEKKVLLKISNLKQWFPIKKSHIGAEQLYVKANDGVSLNIYEGETLGLVGESGCGKSTLGRTILQLYHQTDGKTMYYGRTIEELAPMYPKKIVTHLEKERQTLKALSEHRDKFLEEYKQADEKTQHEKYEEKRKVIKEANDKFLDIVQLVGGFIAVEDVTEAKKLFLEEHAISIEISKLYDKLNDAKIDKLVVENSIERKTAKNKNTDGLKKKLAKIDNNISEITELIKKKHEEHENKEAEINVLRAQQADNEEFQKFEKYLDSGIDLAKLSYKEMRKLRKDMQLIFQDPYSSLNPRMTVGQIIGEGLLAHKFFKKNDDKMQNYVMKVMENCGLAPYMIHRYPHQFSGGQRQRIGIARSLALNPKFVVCDEAVSALDVSIQSQIINLLEDLKEKENLTYLFISHDLSVVKYISDRIGVMYLGNIVELATSEEIFKKPLHPYTEALLLAIPTTDVDKKKPVEILEGDIPSPIKPPKGCKFHTRCRYCTDICKKVEPEFVEAEPGHFVACHHLVDHKVIDS